MSHIRRVPPPPPDRSPCSLMLEELVDVWSVLQLLSSRLAALEARQPADRPQDGPEGA
jgi:hypothetical protein